MKYAVICANFDCLDFLQRKLLTENECFRDLGTKLVENLIVKKSRREYGNKKYWPKKHSDC